MPEEVEGLLPADQIRWKGQPAVLVGMVRHDGDQAEPGVARSAAAKQATTSADHRYWSSR